MSKPLLCRLFGHKIYKNFYYFSRCLRCDTQVTKGYVENGK